MGKNTQMRCFVKLLAIISVEKCKLQMITYSCPRYQRKRFKQQKGNFDHHFEYGVRLLACVPRGDERGRVLVILSHVFQSRGETAKCPSAGLKKMTGLKHTGQVVWPLRLLDSCLEPNIWCLEQTGQPHMASAGTSTESSDEGTCNYGNKCPGTS